MKKFIETDKAFGAVCEVIGLTMLEEKELREHLEKNSGTLGAVEMTIFINKEIKRFVDFYGYDAQSRQCIEEMAELTQAINKFWRKQLKCGRVALEEADRDSPEVTNIIEEIADVLIVLTQLITVFDCVEEIDEVMRNKVNRQLERMEGCV